MDAKINARLFRRELTDSAVRSKHYRTLYSDRRLINDLDIVNELDGHSGCVNALSWSKSGQLLASGSDDQHLNIHQYQPTASENQFQLATTVATGHTQNIFSVKFMPHSLDRTVITAAGDGEVRIFDLEYAGQASQPSRASQTATDERRRGRNNVYNGVRYLSDGDTNSRVYKSHGDRVKRIVTESSPYLFLTCSEDGEVRQWDLRQPSSAYPAPRGGRLRIDSNVPPPLISYRRYQLDLNTISCSANQPHYIALGGAHLHAFLHDRRMIGRDRLNEAGAGLSPAASMSQDEEEQMAQATRCVRKFAPHGKRKMIRTDRGHITACKISDARPNEMIVSWSGDHIYSFDLLRSPDAREAAAGKVESRAMALNRRAQESKDRKRKRKQPGSDMPLGQEGLERGAAKQRHSQVDDEAALRINYTNGQSEDVPILMNMSALRQPLTHDESIAKSIAQNVIKMRSLVLGDREATDDSGESLANAVLKAEKVFDAVDCIMRDWGYPVNPLPQEVETQQTLRAGREATRRFVQAVGTLARVLAGSAGRSLNVQPFLEIQSRRSDLVTLQKEAFGYDFVKAIMLWLDSGVGRLIEGFTRPSDLPASSRAGARLPIPEEDAGTEAIDEILIPYLLRLARHQSVIDPQTNRFETDENRQLFASEKEAVLKFAAAVQVPFADLSSSLALAESGEIAQAQDRRAAVDFWAGRVARGVLLNASEGMEFDLINRCFGGSDEAVADSDDEQNVLDIVSEEDEDDDDYEGSDFEALHYGSGDSSESDSDDSSDPDEVDGVPILGLRRAFASSAIERRKLREKVESDVPCNTHTRVYSGHCNCQTVKDVNYFGLDDEFVVSGSDDGNFFMWDAVGNRKSGTRGLNGKLVGIWEGDGEVVNVVQGHPYETMLAASGIDHTIKIFSADAKARERARFGLGVSAHDASEFSSIAWPIRAGHRRGRRTSGRNDTGEMSTTSEPAVAASLPDPEDDDYIAPSGLTSRKRIHNASHITEQNDSERKSGSNESYITLPQAQLLQILFGNLGNIGALARVE
ncbi:WD40 repeat-like protein [Polychaeton citri CBS 116435]|uniref:WD40 repeat-like protein n=1 Tax=Polychaeton citri CBS 116435 TaxID=1314669 RepID=A0A9P4QBX5_9PEZI|nr:WD40 repeat-like protein [Polychaeton citri CBS 116435]